MTSRNQTPTTLAESLARWNFTPADAIRLLMDARLGFSGTSYSRYEYDQGDQLTVEFDSLYNVASIGLELIDLLHRIEGGQDA